MYGWSSQELKASAVDARRRVDQLLGLSSVVKHSPIKSAMKQKLQHLQSSLQLIDSELGTITIITLTSLSVIDEKRSPKNKK